jgi:hypothetical protein
VGPPKYIQATKAMFAWLEKEVEVIGEYRYTQEGIRPYVSKKSWKNSFYNGMVTGLNQALQEAKRQAAKDFSGGSALVLVEEDEAKKAFRTFFPRTSNIQQRVANNSGYASGLSEGRKFNINGAKSIAG